MKSFSKILIAGLLGGGLSAPAFAQASDAESTTASASIIRALELTKVTNLAFGTIARPATGGGNSTITMSVSSDTPTASGNGGIVSGSTKTRASYTVSAEPSRSVSISVPATTTLNDGGSNDITLNLVSQAASDTLNGSGNFSFAGNTLYVGGNFEITPTTATGTYTATFSTTVAYN